MDSFQKQSHVEKLIDEDSNEDKINETKIRFYSKEVQMRPALRAQRAKQELCTKGKSRMEN